VKFNNQWDTVELQYYTCNIKRVKFENTVGNISAGLDWGAAFPKLLLNPGLYWRLKTLRISLNREMRFTLLLYGFGSLQKSSTLIPQELVLKKN
jgi:hypothetical protein